MDIEKEFAINLKKARKQKEMTQQQIADIAGISLGTISSYENGIKAPSLTIAVKIAQALGVSLDGLCGMEKGAVNTNKETESNEYPLPEILKAIFLLIDIGILKTKEDIKNILYNSFDEDDPFRGMALDVLHELSSKQNIFLIEDEDICEALYLVQQAKELKKTNLPGVDIYKLMLDAIYEKYKTFVVKEKGNGRYLIYYNDCPF